MSLNAVFAALVWGLFVHDLRIIRLRAKDSVGPSSFRLYAIVEADQWLNIRFIMPCLFFFAARVRLRHQNGSGIFSRRAMAICCSSACQGMALLVYLACVVRSFTRITPLISATRAEWRDDVEEGI